MKTVDNSPRDNSNSSKINNNDMFFCDGKCRVKVDSSIWKVLGFIYGLTIFNWKIHGIGK